MFRGRLLVVAALLTLCGSAVASERAHAAFPGENGRIVFTWSSRSAVATVNDAGGDLDVVARSPSNCSRQAGDWSPNGHRLVFTGYCLDGRPYRLVTSRPDGSQREVIFQANSETNALNSPAWSPTGRSLAFIWVHFVPRLGRPVTDIFVIRRDGTHLRRVTNTPARVEGSLDWSSQNRLVFSRGGRPRTELFTIRPDGSKLRRLTNNDVTDQLPDWAPGGGRLTFVRGHEIWTMGIRGGNQRMIATSGFSPAWAPDGSLIAYVNNDLEIHTVEPSGQGDVSIGNPVTGDVASDLDWQPR
jgi:TolB protein